MAIVAEIVQTGPFFAGNTGPALDIILLYDSGGYVPLSGSNITVNIHRWDPRREVPVGPIVTTGDASIVSAGRGEVNFDWNSASPIGSVPLDSGWYMGQADVIGPDGNEQFSQRFVFEVLPI